MRKSVLESVHHPFFHKHLIKQPINQHYLDLAYVTCWKICYFKVLNKLWSQSLCYIIGLPCLLLLMSKIQSTFVYKAKG